MAKPSRLLFPILLCAAALYGLGLGDRGFWEPDEPTFPAIAQEMRAAGDWILPRLNGGLYSEKPILNTWMILASAAVFGRLDEWTARVPAACFGVLGVAIAFLLGRRLFGTRAGLLGAVVLALSPLYFHMARFAYTDGPFSVLYLLCLFLFYRGYSDEAVRRASYRLAWVALALAVLTKGPLAAMLLALTVLTFLALRRDLTHVFKLEISIGLLLFVGIVAPWYVAAVQVGGKEFAHDLLVRQNWSRFSGDYDSHRQPVYYYLGTLPGDFFPWILFVPGMLLHLYRRWRSSREHREVAFVMAAFVPALLFLSLCQSKQGKYLLPVLPALALAVGAFLDAGLSGELHAARRFLTWPIAAAAALALAAGMGGLLILSPIFAGSTSEVVVHSRSPGLWGVVLVAAAILVVGGAVVLAIGPSRRTKPALGALSTLLAAFYLFVGTWALPALDAFKSLRPLGDKVVARLEGRPEFAIYGSYREGFSYYTRKHIEELKEKEELAAYLDRPDRAFVLMRRERFLKLPDGLRGRLAPLEEAIVGSKAYVFLAESTESGEPNAGEATERVAPGRSAAAPDSGGRKP